MRGAVPFCWGLATLIALAPGCSGGPAGPAPVPPDFSGTWLLNSALSDNPQDQQADDRRRGRPLPSGNRARVQPWEGSTLFGSRVFRIEQSDSTVTVVTAEGSPMVLYTDGRTVRGKIEGLGEVRTVATWKGDKLKVERLISGGAKITTTYQFADQKKRLEVETELSGFVRSIDFRLVYDAAPDDV